MQAKTNHLFYDLFWEIYCHERLVWEGYNDDYWWKNLARTDFATTRKCKCGKSYKINFETGEVVPGVEVIEVSSITFQEG